MPVSARIDPFDRDIALMIGEELSPAAQSAAFADMARLALDEADAQNIAALGYRAPHETIVDGSVSTDAGLDAVRPGGVVVFRFKLLADVLERAIPELKHPRKQQLRPLAGPFLRPKFER